MQINIAILTHNALEYTRKCLASLALHTSVPHTVFVMDNGSTDATPIWLRAERDPNLRVLLNRMNVGVPRGRNLLIQEILPRLEDDGFIVFLDNDVEVQAMWCESFLKLFDANPRAGIAGAVGHPIVVHSEWRELLPAPMGESAPVDVASGFCFWVRAKILRLVGFFDENLGVFWHEDDDYCVRAIKLGFEVFALPHAPIVHHGHKSGVAEGACSSPSSSSENQRYLANKWRRLGCVDIRGELSVRYLFLSRHSKANPI